MDFSNITEGVLTEIRNWESKLYALPEDLIRNKRNSQGRTIRQIVGHMIDSASNNTHRIIHLQYQDSPLIFPNYAANGNNDKWIAIQNYQDENWNDLIKLWKYSHLHLVHVIKHVDAAQLDNEWVSATDNGNISLKEMIADFLRHFNLHLGEIMELINE